MTTRPTTLLEAAAARTRPELDPVRQLIVSRTREKRLTLADLSRGAGMNESYVHQFIYRGTPKRLPEDARALMATLLEVPEDTLKPEGGARTPAPLLPTGRPPAAQAASSTSLAVTRDVPVFADTAIIDPAAATEWTWRPPKLLTGGGAFALWISKPCGRLQPGDLAYVRTTQPPRVGDTVAVLKDRTIAALGYLTRMDEAAAEVREAEGGRAKRYKREEVRLLKVVEVEFA